MMGLFFQILWLSQLSVACLSKSTGPLTIFVSLLFLGQPSFFYINVQRRTQRHEARVSSKLQARKTQGFLKGIHWYHSRDILLSLAFDFLAWGIWIGILGQAKMTRVNDNNSNVDFWFDMFYRNQNGLELSNREDQWGHVLEGDRSPKRRNKKIRKVSLDMTSSASDVSEVLSAISSHLSLSSSASSSSHNSSQKSDPDTAWQTTDHLGCKLKDINKREMSYEEKYTLVLRLMSLPEETYFQAAQIMRNRNQEFKQFDLDALDTETLWELDHFVTNHNKMASELMRPALMDAGNDMSTVANNSNEIRAPYTLGTRSLPLQCDNSLATDRNRDEMPNNSIFDARTESQITDLSAPILGKEFASEEEAYNFYKSYANRIGFNIRKGKVQRSSNGEIRKRYFFCSKEGFRSKKQSSEKKRYERKETRTGCNARMECMVKNGKWVISQFFEKHNHVLEDRMNTELQTRISEASHPSNDALMEKVSEITKLVESCSMDCVTNKGDKKASSLQPDDAQNLMDHLTNQQAEDPSFFHAIQLDDDCHLTNIFWSNGISKIDYDYFGDVLILDTSFKVNKHGYNMICAPFFGINHHRQFVLFGCALLLDNSTDSFIWLFKTFMKATGGHQPKSIFTDEGEAIGDAVKLVMPEAQHQIGTWHIHQNASKHLSAYFELPGFKRLLNECISDCETEEEFESRWSALLAQFNLHGNEWLVNLHASRDRWSPIFSRKTFSAGIQGHASIESIFQNLLGSSSTESLSTFVEQYFRAAKRQRREELHEDFHCNETELNMILASCPAGLAEKQAASVYTCTMFKVFQKQLPTLFLVTMNEIANDGTIATFKLTELGKKKEFFVEFNCLDSSVTCSCKKYEYEGILCIHALKVLNSKDIYEIPAQYILKRWTKSAKDGVVADDHGNNKLFYKALNVIAKIAAVEENEKIAEHYLDRAREEIEKLLETRRSKGIFYF